MRKLKSNEAFAFGVLVPVVAIIVYIYTIVHLGYFGGINPSIRVFLSQTLIVAFLTVVWIYLILRYAGERNFVHEQFSWR